MHHDGRCEDFLEFTEKLGFDASAAQTDEDGMDAIDNALDWLNGANDGKRFILAEFGVVVAVPA
jgi:hypothetical protein